MYDSSDNNKIQKKQKIINILKKICIFLLIVNFGMVRLNILSPKNLKIFYDRNKILINIIYSFLGAYIVIYFVLWGHEFYTIKKITKKYSQLK